MSEIVLYSVFAKWSERSVEQREIFSKVKPPVKVVEVDKDLFPDKAEELEEIGASFGIHALPLNVIFYKNIPIYASGFLSEKDVLKLVEVVKSLISANERRVLEEGKRITENVENRKKGKEGLAGLELLKSSLDRILDVFDYTYGGFGFDLKFPFPFTHISLLLLRRFREVEISVTEIMDGGVRDHIFGGFFRYCLERSWDDPVKVKTTVENAEMLILLSLAYRKLGIRRLRDVAKETVDFLFSVKKELFGNCVILEKVEFAELDELERKFLNSYYGFEKLGYARIIASKDSIADELGINYDEVDELTKKLRRKARAKFQVDDREISSYNFHVATALNYYSAIFDEKVGAEIILKKILKKRFKDVLYRFDDVEAGFEDYSYGIFSLVVNQYLNDWGLEEAEELFKLSKDHWKVFDSRTASPLSLKILSALHLHHLTGEKKYREYAKEELKRFAGYEHNIYSGTYLVALKTYLRPIYVPKIKKFIAPDVFFWEKDWVEYAGKKFKSNDVKAVVDG